MPREQLASRYAIHALGAYLAAGLDDDTLATTAALDQVLAFVHRDGASDPRAPARLAWLCTGVTRMVADLYSAPDAPEARHALNATLSQAVFPALPEPARIALTAVALTMRGDPDGAATVITTYAVSRDTQAMTHVLDNLASLHTVGHLQRDRFPRMQRAPTDRRDVAAKPR